MNTIAITFGLDETHIEDDDRLAFATQLLPLLQNECDAVERVDRTEDLNPEAGSKGFATLVGFLTAEVTLESLKEFIGFLGDRLGDKPLKVQVGDVAIEASSLKELEQLEEIAMRMYQKLNQEDSPLIQP
ncbi:MAG: hypothetical protein ACO3EZ_09045 [Prochlorotrichaceae cyanobacterium]